MAPSLLGKIGFALGLSVTIVIHGCGSSPREFGLNGAGGKGGETPISVSGRSSSGGSGGGSGKPGANDGGANDGGASDGGASDGGANDGGANDGGANDGASAGNATGGAHTSGAGGSNAGGAKPSSGGSSVGGAHTSGAGGSNAGGANAGGASTAGSGGSAPSGIFACAGTKPVGALITSFADLSRSSSGNFTFQAGLPGGTFSYQSGELTLSATPELTLNIKGTVSTYDGFGFFLNNCADASAYTGVSFTIKGSAGPSGKLDFRIQTNANTAADTTNMRGGCAVPAGTTDTYPLCHAASTSIPVTSTDTVVSVKFSDLTGGAPNLSVSGKDLIGFEWAFAWSNGAAYPVDVTLDNVQLTN